MQIAENISDVDLLNEISRRIGAVPEFKLALRAYVSDKLIEGRLNDMEGEALPLSFRAEAASNGVLAIEIENHGDAYGHNRHCDDDVDKYGGVPVIVENCEGTARVIVWADRGQEDPTHIISLEKAKLTSGEEVLD